MNTFKDEQYTITTSLNERAIYIKIINNISYMYYEGNFDGASFKLPFELADVYKLINKCFANERDSGYEKRYSVHMELDNNVLTLTFHCIVGGFLNMTFDLLLREKLMSNDAQLSVNFHRLEQKQQSAVEQLTKRMEEMERRLEALGHANICFTNPPSNDISAVYSYPISSKQIIISDVNNGVCSESFKKVQYFYQLEELSLYNCQWCSPEKHVSSKTVKKLTIQGSPTFRDISFIKNFPSLKELAMVNIVIDASIVTTLRSISHKITKFAFTSCTGINQTEMQTYCTQNGIELSLA